MEEKTTKENNNNNNIIINNSINSNNSTLNIDNSSLNLSNISTQAQSAISEESLKTINTQQPVPETTKPQPLEQKNSKNDLIENPKPIQLVLSKNDILEMTTEAINILTALKKEKLCIISINGPVGTGKSILANNLIENKTGFKTGITTEGIWLWNCPILLENGNKLLVLDCQGLNKDDKISNKLFILSVLLSTCVIYYTEGNLNEDLINQFYYFIELLTEIKISKEENDDINKIKNIFPELIFVNNILPEDNIQQILEQNNKKEIINTFFEKINYINIIDKDITKIKEKMPQMKSKEMYKINIDGDSLFCLLQNYIDFINTEKPIIINLAFENVLLSKAKNVSEMIFQQFKNDINKKVSYPIEYPLIYKTHFELQKEYFQKFCERIDKILTPVKTGEYIGKIFDNMIVELQSILEKNKEILYEKICLEYKAFEEKMKKNNLSSLEEIKIFILSYTLNFKSCMKNFFDIIKTNFNESTMEILSKIFEEFIYKKLNQLGETICALSETYSKKHQENIDNLNNKIKNLNEQIESDKKLLENTKKENMDKLKLATESELKIKKSNDEMKLKISELENKNKTQEEAMKKLEVFDKEQIKEKENEIIDLRKKLEKIQLDKSDLDTKILELQKEKEKLKNEIEENKKKQVKKTTGENDGEIQSLFKKINTDFTDFIERIDKLEKNNIKSLTEKINYKDEIDIRMNTCEKDIKEAKSFCQSQIKEVEENYKKEILRANEKIKDLTKELDQVKLNLKEKEKLQEVFDNKLAENDNQINDLNKNIEERQKLLNIKTELIKAYEEKINNNNKKINDLEISLCNNIYSYKMAEDDFETLLIILQGILQKDKEKYCKNIKKLSSKGKNLVISLVEKYHVFF